MLVANTFSEITYALINAIDSINPILKGHHRRVAVLSLHIGAKYGLSNERIRQLVLSALLHDIGALTAIDEIELTQFEVENPEPHANLGSLMLMSCKYFEKISEIIKYHHKRYDDITEDENVSVESLIVHLADRIEVLLNNNILALIQKENVIDKIKECRGTVFSDEIVDAFLDISAEDSFWLDIDNLSVDNILNLIDISSLNQDLTSEDKESLVYTFSRIIDFRTQYTIAHTPMVAHIAEQLSQALGLDDDRCSKIKIAAYLHDYGKLAIPSELMSKGKLLSIDEKEIIKSHHYYTSRIINDIPSLQFMSKWTDLFNLYYSDLENLNFDYFGDLSLEVQIIVCSDLFASLFEARPYRKACTLEEILEKFDECFSINKESEVYVKLLGLSERIFDEIQDIYRTIFAEYNNETIHSVHDRKKNHYLKLELLKLNKTDNRIFEFIQEGVLDGLWYWDLEKPENEWMDSQFWNLFGFSSDEKEHLSNEWQDMIFKEDLELALDNFHKHSIDPNHPYDQIVRYKHKDGSTVWVRCRGIIVRDSSGKPIRMLGAHVDLTEQKKLQSDLEKTNKKLIERQIEIEKLNERLVKLSSEDHLTGLYNRHLIDKLLLEEKKRVERGGKTFSVLMMDINKFKQINDVYGHLVGDMVLVNLANNLSNLFRAQDIKSRWGGDEFLILLPHTNAEEVIILLRKLYESQENWSIPYEGTEIKYRVSIGFSTYVSGENMDQLLNRADKKLYEAKELNRSISERNITH